MCRWLLPVLRFTQAHAGQAGGRDLAAREKLSSEEHLHLAAILLQLFQGHLLTPSLWLRASLSPARWPRVPRSSTSRAWSWAPRPSGTRFTSFTAVPLEGFLGSGTPYEARPG